MKLFYIPGSCSLSPHIVACEAGIDLTLVKVDFATKETEGGIDFAAINPKGYVPVLQLDSGELLTEVTAVLQYLADSKPRSGLVPANGTFSRYRVQEWLGYINSELHKGFSPMFKRGISAEMRAERIAYLTRLYAFVETALTGKPYLTGESFSIADAYLFTVTSWATHFFKIDLAAFQNVQAFQKRVAAREGVKAAMIREGLIAA